MLIALVGIFCLLFIPSLSQTAVCLLLLYVRGPIFHLVFSLSPPK